MVLVIHHTWNLIDVPLVIGGIIWLVAFVLIRGGAKRFTRDQLAARV